MNPETLKKYRENRRLRKRLQGLVKKVQDFTSEGK